MNGERIEELARILQTYGLGVIECETNGEYIRLEAAVQRMVMPAEPIPQAAAEPVPYAPIQAPDGDAVDFNAVCDVHAPMVGVFYNAPEPDAEPFVSVGSQVKKGDVLCIIEAMKLMNEIVAETDGEIVDVCVGNGQIVEYGQTLFKIF